MIVNSRRRRKLEIPNAYMNIYDRIYWMGQAAKIKFHKSRMAVGLVNNDGDIAHRLARTYTYPRILVQSYDKNTPTIVCELGPSSLFKPDEITIIYILRT